MPFAPKFWSRPFRPYFWLRWAAHEHPAYTAALTIFAFCPITAFSGGPIRRALGDVDPELVPMVYPIPTGPRAHPKGFEDA